LNRIWFSVVDIESHQGIGPTSPDIQSKHVLFFIILSSYVTTHDIL